MTDDYVVVDSKPGWLARFVREFQTLIVAGTALLIGYIELRRSLGVADVEDLHTLAIEYAGPSWWFFATVAGFLFWTLGALIVEVFGLGASRRWQGISEALEWATEISPMVGLLTTVASLLIALLVYGEAGPGKPETQQAFISGFGVALGSTICGGVLATISFTLHWALNRFRRSVESGRDP